MLVVAARADDSGAAEISHGELSKLTRMDVRSLRRLLFREDSPIPASELELTPGGNLQAANAKLRNTESLCDHAFRTSKTSAQ